MFLRQKISGKFCNPEWNTVCYSFYDFRWVKAKLKAPLQFTGRTILESTPVKRICRLTGLRSMFGGKKTLKKALYSLFGISGGGERTYLLLDRGRTKVSLACWRYGKIDERWALQQVPSAFEKAASQAWQDVTRAASGGPWAALRHRWVKKAESSKRVPAGHGCVYPAFLKSAPTFLVVSSDSKCSFFGRAAFHTWAYG